MPIPAKSSLWLFLSSLPCWPSLEWLENPRETPHLIPMEYLNWSFACFLLFSQHFLTIKEGIAWQRHKYLDWDIRSKSQSFLSYPSHQGYLEKFFYDPSTDVRFGLCGKKKPECITPLRAVQLPTGCIIYSRTCSKLVCDELSDGAFALAQSQ